MTEDTVAEVNDIAIFRSARRLRFFYGITCRPLVSRPGTSRNASSKLRRWQPENETAQGI